MKKALCILVIIMLAVTLSGCGLVVETIRTILPGDKDDGRIPYDPLAEYRSEEKDKEPPDKDVPYDEPGEGKHRAPKLADAPRYRFGGGEFLLFNGKPVVSELNGIWYMEFYSRLNYIPDGEFDDHKVEEAIEVATGGELFGLLASPLINANDFVAGRRAAIIDGEQKPWTFLHMRLFYPDPGSEADTDKNYLRYDEDMTTIFSNCDVYFVKGGYSVVCVSANWGDDGMKVLRGYLIEDGTFLNEFE